MCPFWSMNSIEYRPIELIKSRCMKPKKVFRMKECYGKENATYIHKHTMNLLSIKREKQLGSIQFHFAGYNNAFNVSIVYY